MNNSPIGIFDSGSGGLTVLDSCRKLMPHEKYIYVSDSRKGGWGSLTVNQIEERAAMCVDKLISEGCKAVVAACNTATEASIGYLRRIYGLPLVGVEPAVKPAVKAYPGGRVVVLCTPATARQPKFKALLRSVGGKVRVSAQPRLASMIESNIHSLDSLKKEAEHIVLCEQADAYVLGCTHYVFIRYIFEELVGEERVFDGNAGVAHRLYDVLSGGDMLSDGTDAGGVGFCSV